MDNKSDGQLLVIQAAIESNTDDKMNMLTEELKAMVT